MLLDAGAEKKETTFFSNPQGSCADFCSQLQSECHFNRTSDWVIKTKSWAFGKYCCHKIWNYSPNRGLSAIQPESPYGILANVGYMEYGVTDVE